MTNSEITDGSGSTVEADYTYDPLGRLYEVSVVGGDTRRYLWDGDAIIGEYDGTGALTQRYVHLPGSLGAPVVLYEGSGVTVTDRRFLQTDERGSVIAITHAQTGAQTAANSYSAYGEPGSGNSGPFGYTGQLWLPEAGLWYMRNRVYEPALGRFMQTDPIGYQGGMNLYGYVEGDPVNGVDPLGLRLVTCPDGVTPGCLAVEGQRIDPCSIGWSCTSIDQLESPRGPTRFFGGDDGGGGGGRTTSAERESDAACRIINRRAGEAIRRLPRRVTRPRNWTNPAALRFDRDQYLSDARQFRALEAVTGLGGVLLAFLPIGRLKSGLSAATGLSLTATLSEQADRLEQNARDIQRRLDQFEVQRQGQCLRRRGR